MDFEIVFCCCVTLIIISFLIFIYCMVDIILSNRKEELNKAELRRIQEQCNEMYAMYKELYLKIK